MNSFIAWIGGKRLLRKAIIERFPEEGFDRYIEVFGGAGWVLFGKEVGKELEVFNDADSNLINLYRCIKYHCEELQKELNWLAISREQFFDNKSQLNARGLTDIQRAARYFHIIKVSFGADRKTFGTNKKNLTNSIEYLAEVQGRLKNVVIENRDFESLIRVYDRPGALFYLDPPYHGTEKYYEGGFSHDDHIRLKTVLDVLQIRTCILDLNQQYDENPYGIYPMYTLQNAVVANEVIRRKRIQRNLTQSVLSEGILEPENYSRYENGRLNIRWEKIAQILDRLEQNTEKEQLILDTYDVDVMEQYFQCGKLGHQAQMRYSRMWYRQLCDKLDMDSKVNQQYIGFQILVQQKMAFQREQLEQMESKIQDLLNLTIAKKWNQNNGRIYTRNEVLLFNLYANILHEEGKTPLAIESQRKVLNEFEQYKIRKKYTNQAQTLLMENYSSMLGDSENYKQALAINYAEIKCFLSNARAWGIELILYDIAWNLYEAKKNNIQFPTSYQIAYKYAVLLSKLQKDEFFLFFLYERKDKFQN